MKRITAYWKEYSILLAIVLVGAYFALNIFSYFFALDWCRIKIHGSLSGDRGTIKSAIKLLRQTDRVAYGVLCKNIDYIYEKYCIDDDWHLNPDNYLRRDAAGCYIKGSRALYISPSRDTSAAEVRLRADTLKKLAGYSRDFWEKQSH